MFRKTLIKLTLLNTAIFLVLLGLLGAAVYFYTDNVLYRGVNQNLIDASRRFDGVHFNEPQVGLIIWDSNNQIVGIGRSHQLPDEQDVMSTLKKLEPKTLNQIIEKKVSSDYYRTYSVKMISATGIVTTAEFYMKITVQKSVLHTLLIIIIVSMVIGILLAAVAGFFLAHRALNPIKNAWDRQQQFVSDASHEIRTPLAIIQSRIELLLRSPRSMIQEKINDISISLQETRRLSKLVTHLLTLARSDANQIEIGMSPVLLNDLIRNVTEQFEEIANFQEKKLTLNMGHQPMTVTGDKERLHQLLVIFLDNALKFTDEGGEVRVTCRQENSNVILEVKDTGIGIKPEHLKKIFDRFFQADTSRTDREGTGLGLSIAKWIVDKHKGKLNVESQYGQGTTFTISFPTAKSQPKE